MLLIIVIFSILLKMVVLQHESLHQTLWGPAAQRGRTRATDAGIYLQTVACASSLVSAVDWQR